MSPDTCIYHRGIIDEYIDVDLMSTLLRRAESLSMRQMSGEALHVKIRLFAVKFSSLRMILCKIAVTTQDLE